MDERVERERKAYDEKGVEARSKAWHSRFPHVFLCPNTRHHDALFFELVGQAVRGGGRSLELGCGYGWASRRAVELGAGYALGLDVSESLIAEARREEIPGRLEFRLADASSPPDGEFDLIFGLGILHHLDWRSLLERLHERHLRPGGRLLFLEPLGESLLLKLYRGLSRDAHTEDEVMLTRADLRWVCRRFPHVELHARNYLSLPAGILSSRLSSDPENALLRACDRIDRWLAAHVRALVPRFRQVTILVSRPASPSMADPRAESG